MRSYQVAEHVGAREDVDGLQERLHVRGQPVALGRRHTGVGHFRDSDLNNFLFELLNVLLDVLS